MLKRTETSFSHVKPGDTQFVSRGLRDFFFIVILGLPRQPMARSSRTL